MSGILNKKTRIMDVIMTQEGKRQLAAGDFQVKYASFTDGGTFYDKTSISGSYDEAQDRLYFEACSYPFDSITIEANDHGNVLSQNISVNNDGSRIIVADGKILIASSSRNPIINNAASDSSYASFVNEIIKSTTSNFKKQRIIASRDPLDDSDEFLLSTGSISLTYGNSGPIVGEELIPRLDQAPSLFTHKRFSNSLNFQYLPPIVNTRTGSIQLGKYTDIKTTESYTFEDLMTDLSGSTTGIKKPHKTINFDITTTTNDITIQAFETNSEYLKKLDVVDFGEFKSNSNTSSNSRVLFLGKVFVDKYKTPTFANIFTIVLE